jgi:DNA-binding protein H-NS
MAKKADLSKMSLDELKQLKKDVDAAIKGYSERQRAEAMKAIEAVAKEHGMSIDEIIGGKGRKRKAKAPAKFANPGNPNDTWSGRGRQPGWYKDAVSAGKAPESMAI